MFNVNSLVETNVELELRQTLRVHSLRCANVAERTCAKLSSLCFEKWQESIWQLGESRARGQMLPRVARKIHIEMDR
jgi:hypothetical protein